MKYATITEMTSAGGKARAAKLSPERRKEIATQAGLAGKGVSRNRPSKEAKP